MARQKVKGISISSANAAGSANATSGYVLKADGSGGAAWGADSTVGGTPSFTTATISASDPVLNIARTGNYTYKIGSLANDTFAIQSNETSDASYASLIEIDSYAHQESGPAIKILNNGNVGIGTSSPEYELEVKASTDASINIRAGTNSGDFAGLYFGDTDYPAEGRITYQNSDNKMRFWSDRQHVMTLDDNARVGIGTESPSYKLHVEGPIGDQQPLFLGTVTGNPSANFNWVAEYMASSLAQDKRIVIALGKARSTNNSATISYVQRADSDDNAIAFGHFGANDLVNFTYEGAVGIGTTRPTEGYGGAISDVKLALLNGVSGNDNGKSTLLIGGDNRHYSYITGGHTSSGLSYLDFGTASSATNPTFKMRLDAAGHLLFGTTSDAQDSGAGVKIKYDNSNGRVFTISSNSSGECFSAYQVGAGYKFYVTNNGKIHTAVGPAVYNVSDERLKENVRDYDKGLADILKLKPRLFDWKEGEGSNEKNVSGFIAQECEAAGFDEFVAGFKHDTLTDAKSFGAGGLITAAIKAIQELSAEVEELKAKLEG